MDLTLFRRFGLALLVPALLIVFVTAALYYESALAEMAGDSIYFVLAIVGMVISGGSLAFYIMLKKFKRALPVQYNDKSPGYVSIKRCIQLAVGLGAIAGIMITGLSLYEYASGQVLVAFGETRGAVFFHNRQGAHDPTYQELIAFLKNDTTDLVAYNDSRFVCTDFTVTVHDNAERYGIKAGGVLILGDVIINGRINDHDRWNHALNVFRTTDKGLVYVDCTGGRVPAASDKIAYISIGAPYRVINIDRAENHSYAYYMSCLLDTTNRSDAYDYDSWDVRYKAMLW